MKITRIIFLIILSCSLIPLTPQQSFEQDSSQIYSFNEIWAYVMRGEETYLSNSMPFTDIGYFSANINELGALPADIQRPDLTGEFDKPARVHLVISAPWNKTILSFCLRKDMPLREKILADIIALSKDFDGVQIDFEAFYWEDKDNYISFLNEVHAALPEDKIFSVAVPARWWTTQNVFDYAEISAIADRVIVMAYDESPRTGEPGPIASLPWCKKVLDYAKQYIPEEKLVMGLPLYGRAWQREVHERALKYPQTNDLCQRLSCALKLTETGSPYFEYTDTVNVAVHFEDMQSLTSKIDTYANQQVRKIAFWRIGQEPTKIWELLSHE